jgi:hypothetical protein
MHAAADEIFSESPVIEIVVCDKLIDNARRHVSELVPEFFSQARHGELPRGKEFQSVDVYLVHNGK